MKEPRNIAQVFICISLLVTALSLNATGPSRATIKIVPLATNSKGSVIFKTYSHINKSGRHSLEGAEYGWLCASSSGIWEERLYYRITESDSADSERTSFYATQFENRTDLDDPPESLKALMDKHGFDDWETIRPRTGAGQAVWSAEKICTHKKCSKLNIEQRTLGGISSNDRKGKPVTSLFHYEGVILFESYFNYDDAEQRGAFFPIANIFQGEDIGIDIYSISGISVFGLE